MIIFFPNLETSMNETFISYSRHDKTKVEILFQALKGKGIDPWLDTEDIRPTTQWREEILIAIQRCHNFVYCISPGACNSPYCEMELLHALLHNKRIIPVLVEDVVIDSVNSSIRELQWIVLDSPEGLEQLTIVIEAPEGIGVGDGLNSRIEIIQSNEFNRIFNLYRTKYLIGRYPNSSIKNCGIILLDESTQERPFVSKTHCTLELIDNRWHLLDGYYYQESYTPSVNGVRVNGKKLEFRHRRPLRNRDVMKVSNSIAIIYEEVYPLDLVVPPDSRDTAV